MLTREPTPLERALPAILEQIAQTPLGQIRLDKTLVGTDLASMWAVGDRLLEAGALVDSDWDGWTIRWKRAV